MLQSLQHSRFGIVLLILHLTSVTIDCQPFPYPLLSSTGRVGKGPPRMESAARQSITATREKGNSPTQEATDQVTELHAGREERAIPWQLPAVGIGTNLEGVEDYAVAYPFADFFKQSREWIAGNASQFDTQQSALLDLDGNGWVRSLPACTSDSTQFCMARTIFNSAYHPYPGGRYVVVYEGEGVLTYSGGANKVPELSRDGRDVIEVNGNQLWILTIESTNTANYLRNIRVYPPGIDPLAAPTFHPHFLQQLAPYRSVRFMDWMRTNGSGFSGEPNPQQEFGHRPTVSQAHWSSAKGVPLEAMIELANVAVVEPWFTLPHRVSDSYVDQFAQLVFQQLAPGRRVYLEYSNEVWNSAFPQGLEVETRGAELFGSLGDPFIRRLNAHGLRTAEICQIFKARFGSQSNRITCVLGAQAANSFTTTEAADCPLAVQVGRRTSPCRTDFDSVAIAPYFGNYLNLPVNTNELENWSVNKLFDEIRHGGQLNDLYPNVATPCTENWPPQVTGSCSISALEEIVPWIRAHSQVAIDRNLRLLAYEGGQHLVGVFGAQDNESVANLFVAVNRDQQMADVYAEYLNLWRMNGGELFMHFTLTFGAGKFGSWGALESLTPDQRPPKAAAIDAFNAANPCWWPGCNQVVEVLLPGTPSHLTASAFSATQINLRWTDNATNETSFLVERKTGAGGAWSVLATVGANVTVYADTELAAGTYFYRVSAGNSDGMSAASNEASATTLAAPGAGTARESLTQNRTYFVSPSGSDSNDGLTSGASFASLQYAFNLIESTLDLKGSTVMIRASPGTYTSGIVIRNWTGGGEIILDLGGATVSATGTNAISTLGVLGGTLRIQNGTLRTTSAGNALSHGAAGTLIIDSGINFGPTAANHINIQSPGSLVVVLGSYTISGGAVNHIVANGSGTIFRHIRGTVTVNAGGAVIPFSSYFAYAGFGGFIYSGATYEIVNGSVSGIRYISFLNSIIYSTRGPSHFPGTIAGSAITGGQYQ